MKLKPFLATLRSKMIDYTTRPLNAQIWACLCLLWGCFGLVSCGTVKYLPSTTEKTIINYVDSTRIKDSVVVIPVERIVDVIPMLDTLTLETSIAKSVSYLDTTSLQLKGEIKNKQKAQFKYITKERIVERVDTVYITQNVPVEVPVKYVPAFYKYCLGCCIVVILFLILWCLKKVKLI